MLEPHTAGIDHLDLDVAQCRPVGVQARRQDVAEATFDPDQSPLVVLQIQDDRAVLQRTGTDDHVQLLVHQPRRRAARRLRP